MTFSKLSRRTVFAGALAIVNPVVEAASAVDDGAEWSEFREWYALTMEEERIFNDASIKTDDEREPLLQNIDARVTPLQEAMLCREATSLAQMAIVALIALRLGEKWRNPKGCRMFDLGSSLDLTSEDTGDRAAAHLVDAVIRLALAQGCLPGVIVHGPGGNGDLVA